jgi:hypothetical protein
MLAAVSHSDWASSYASQGKVSLWRRVDGAHSTHRQVRSLPIVQRDGPHNAAETNAAAEIASTQGDERTPSDSSVGFEACSTLGYVQARVEQAVKANGEKGGKDATGSFQGRAQEKARLSPARPARVGRVCEAVRQATTHAHDQRRNVECGRETCGASKTRRAQASEDRDA